jgi:hypothetical protein
MVEEKLKRSTKQPKVAPEAAAAAPRPAPAHRPGAFVPREPAGTAAGAALALTPAGGYGLSSRGGSGDAEEALLYGAQQQYSADDTLQYSRQAFTPPNALATPLPQRPATSYVPAQQQQYPQQQQYQQYPPPPQQQQFVAPTPVPGMRPYSANGELAPAGSAAGCWPANSHLTVLSALTEYSSAQLPYTRLSCACAAAAALDRGGAGGPPSPASAADDADFDQRWSDCMVGITSDNVDEAVEHMKLMCGDMLTCVQVGRQDSWSAAAGNGVSGTPFGCLVVWWLVGGRDCDLLIGRGAWS